MINLHCKTGLDFSNDLKTTVDGVELKQNLRLQ